MNLSGKKALVCGSTQGIGKATAIALANMGANLVLIARNETKLIETLAEIPKPFVGQQHTYLVADFSQPIALQKVIDTYIKEGNTIHILINNSGGQKAVQLKMRIRMNLLQHLISI